MWVKIVKKIVLHNIKKKNNVRLLSKIWTNLADSMETMFYGVKIKNLVREKGMS